MAVFKPRRARERAQGPGTPWSLAAKRGLGFGAIWWAMTDGDHDSWPLGCVCVLLALTASLWLAPRRVARISLLGVAAFVPFFIAKTVSGSVDVARRAIHPRLPIDPEVQRYRLLYPRGPGRLLFVAAVNLLPGTVAAEIEDDHLRVHVIDRSRPLDVELAALERRVAALFRQEAPA
jgi:multicomponent Na+:H+ antiporter subunit E